ncbi:hypothetical protein BGZ63DRAFT_512083, partial [Mariannaea sp. PMI_226]
MVDELYSEFRLGLYQLTILVEQAAKEESVAQEGQNTSVPEIHDPSKIGLKVLHDCPDATVDICFIHGLTGDRESDWTAEGQSMPWPQTLLPSKVEDARILSYGYRITLTETHGPSFQYHSMNLLVSLADDRSACDATYRPLIFVAHGAGGLLIKQALRLNDSGRIFEYIKGIMFLGTPHRGFWVADWAKLPAAVLGLVTGTSMSLLQMLQVPSEELVFNQDQFLRFVKKRRHEGCGVKIASFCEGLRLHGGEMIVSQDAASFEGACHVIPADHKNMVKFSSPEDYGFTQILKVLTEWISTLQYSTATRLLPRIDE